MLGLKYNDLSLSPCIVSQIIPSQWHLLSLFLFCGSSGWIVIPPVQQGYPSDSRAFPSLFLSFSFRLTCPGGCRGSRTRRRWAVRPIGFLPFSHHFKTTAVIYISKKNFDGEWLTRSLVSQYHTCGCWSVHFLLCSSDVLFGGINDVASVECICRG